MLHLPQIVGRGHFPFAVGLKFAVVLTVVLGLTLATANLVVAGDYNPVLSPGDAAPAWEGLPATDGSKHSLADLEKAPVVVVAFTCNSCPYAVDVEDRLIALTKSVAEKEVAVVAINVNYTPADSAEKMKARAEEKGFNFPYLFDESQKIAKAYGATRTPEFFVLNKDRQVVYMGALDDSPDGKNVSKKHVEAAVAAALEGNKPEVQETIPIGCNIRFKRERR